MKLSGKVAVITGGSEGIGKAIATKFAEEGAKTVLCARNLEKLDKAADEIQGLKLESGSKIKVLTVSADLSTLEGAKQLIRAAINEFGRIDILVNNAGISGPIKGVLELSFADWKRVIDINLNGAFFCSKLALEHMMKENIQGKIINVSSVLGKHGAPYVSAYCASKAAVISLTESLALECGRNGIHVNVICPGATETDMLQEGFKALAEKMGASTTEIEAEFRQKSALGRFTTTGELASVALFLATDDSSGITGETFTVSAGAAYY